MDAVSGFATLIWPPTGIALAALLLFGYRLWPAVALGAFLVNYVIGAPFWSAWGVATGNTLEAVVGAFLLQKFTNFDKSLSRITDIFWFFVLAAGVSTLVSATIGVSTLALSHTKSFEGFAVTWAAWWGGDAMGDIIVAPLFLVWGTTVLKFRFNWLKVLECLLLVGMVGVFCYLTFGKGYRVGFLIFPMGVWVALRFGQVGAVSFDFIISFLLAWAAARGVWPTKGGTFRENLYVMLGFSTVVAMTGMTLAASVSERKRAIESRDEFLSIVSHELKNPLTSLSLHIEMTEMEINVEKNLAPPPKRLAEVFAVSMYQINRLTNLVENLLDFSRIGAGKLRFSFDDLNLSEMVTEMAKRFSGELKRADCELTVDIQKNLVIEGDRTRLEQLLENLISNIIKYAPGAPAKITLKAEGIGVRVMVEDKGPGIPRDLQSKMFERFERGLAPQSVAGIGLGLFIVTEIIKGHQGTISLESDRGMGVKLTLDLPMKQT